jgi:exodeoxyribonuclease VII small subunit
MSETKKTYREAFNRLQEIASLIENNEVEIDELADLIKEAKDLKRYCDSVLNQTKKDIEDSLRDEGTGSADRGSSDRGTSQSSDVDDLPF